MKKNNSIMKCCICNNEKIGEFITINDKKYHLCCIEDLKKQKNDVLREINFYETTEWGLRGYEILEKFRRMLGEIDNDYRKHY